MIRRKIQFWHDWWVEKRDLKDKYPRLFKLSTQKNVMVTDILGDNMIMHYSRALDPVERIDFLELIHGLRNTILT